MARYRKIDPRIWNDAKFSELSQEAKLIFFYLLTAPAMTMIGALPMRSSAVAEELGLDPKRYAIRYRELSDKGMAEYDERGLFWVKNFLRYNAPDNPKVVVSWAASFDLLPECPLLLKVIESARSHCLQRGEGYAESFRKAIGNRYANGMPYGMPNPMPYQEQEQEQEQEYITTSDEVVREKTSDELFSTPVSPKEKPLKQQNCPTQEIVAAYNEKLGPYLGAVRKMTAARMSAVRARWLDVIGIVESNDKAECLKGMNDYFDKIARSDFLMGRVPGKTWKASFDFIFSAAGFTKIFEGKYENGR